MQQISLHIYNNILILTSSLNRSLTIFCDIVFCHIGQSWPAALCVWHKNLIYQSTTFFQGEEGESIEATLESLLAPARDYPGYDAIAEWEVEDDPDLVNEPVLSLDMQVSDHMTSKRSRACIYRVCLSVCRDTWLAICSSCHGNRATLQHFYLTSQVLNVTHFLKLALPRSKAYHSTTYIHHCAFSLCNNYIPFHLLFMT